jgi:hypothetical protein
MYASDIDEYGGAGNDGNTNPWGVVRGISYNPNLLKSDSSLSVMGVIILSVSFNL